MQKKWVTLVLSLLLIISTGVKGETFETMEISKEKKWPVLKTYDQDHLARLALPIGGIGTGTISLMGNGALRHWEVMNRPAKSFHGVPTGNRAPFFAIFMHQEGKQPVSRALMGPLEYYEYESSDGTGADNHGMPRFRKAVPIPLVRSSSIGSCMISSAYFSLTVFTQDA